MKKIIITIVCVILVGALMCFAVYKLSKTYEKNKDSEIETIDVNSDIVKSLYDEINVFNDFDDGSKYYGLIFGDYTTSTLPNDAKLFMAFSKLVDKKDFDSLSLTSEDVDNAIKEIFGDIEYTNQSIDNVGCGLTGLIYDETTNYYIKGTSKCNDANTKIVTKLISAEKNNDDIVLKQKMYVETNGTTDDRDGNKISIKYAYDAINRSRLIAKGNLTEEIMFDEYNNQLDTYSYTFKYNSDDDKYYFESVTKETKELSDEENQVKENFTSLYNDIIKNNKSVDFIPEVYRTQYMKNTKEFNVTNVFYNSSTDVYSIVYTYKCNDNSSSCLYSSDYIKLEEGKYSTEIFVNTNENHEITKFKNWYTLE